MIKFVALVSIAICLSSIISDCTSGIVNLEKHVRHSPTTKSPNIYTYHYFSANGALENAKLVFAKSEFPCSLDGKNRNGYPMDRDSDHFSIDVDMGDCPRVAYEIEIIHRDQKSPRRIMDKLNRGYQKTGISYFEREENENN